MAVFLWFHATTVLPLGTALTLNYTSPLFLALLVIGRRHALGQAHRLAADRHGGHRLRRRDPRAEAELRARARRSARAAGLFSGVLSPIAYWQVKELGDRGEPEWRVVFYFSLIGAMLGGLGSLAIGFTDHTPGGALLLAGHRHLDVAGAARHDARLRSRPHADGREPAVLRVVFASVLGVILFDDRFR